MRTSTFLAAPALAFGALAMAAAPAAAHEGHGGHEGASTYSSQGSWTSMATLNSMNNSGTTGDATVQVDGNEATVTMHVQGAAETFMDGPFPHAQHIHIGAQGVCPPPEADMNGDGAVNVAEGHDYYGMIASSLTTEGDTGADSGLAVDRFPGGSEYTYERTLQVDDATKQAIEDGTAVVVVHGVDPMNLSEQAQNEMSELDPSLPLAATLPAACGTLTATQMDGMPAGGAETGVAQGTDDTAAIVGVSAGAAGLVALGGGALYLRRRRAAAQD